MHTCRLCIFFGHHVPNLVYLITTEAFFLGRGGMEGPLKSVPSLHDRRKGGGREKTLSLSLQKVSGGRRGKNFSVGESFGTLKKDNRLGLQESRGEGGCDLSPKNEKKYNFLTAKIFWTW